METWTVDASHLGRSVCLGFGISALICLAATTWAKHTLEPALRRTPRRAVQALPRGVLASTPQPPRPPPPPPPPPLATAPPAGLQWPEVAMCVGGMLTLHVPGRGRSVRLGVVEALRRPDVFVAGTLNASSAAEASGPAWRRRVRAALAGLSALRPFAAASVEPQPTRDELIAALRASGRWEAYARQASGAGEGRLSAADADPRLWLPTMLSPALGNPSGHTLREFHYQARCMRMIEARERAAGGRPYGRVLFTRLELEWLRPHPPLELLDPAVTWVPAGEDNFGVVDRHWLAPRAAAARLMGRWDALVDGSAVEVVHGHGSGGGHVALARVTPRFVSSEIYLERTLSFYGLRVGRFPMVAFLQCCEESYLDAQGRGIRSEHWGVLSTGVGAARGAKTCFQAHCNKKRCPRAAPLWRAQREPGMCAFKYDDEGSSAVINAEILALPHARLRPAADPPMRLEITLDVSTEAGVRVAPFFFCMRCNAQHALTPATNLTAGCLFRAGYTYSDQLVARAAREHNCRYFDSVGMEQLCASFTRPGDEPDHRGTTYAEKYYPWWCRGRASYSK